MSLLDRKQQLDELWKKLQESAEEFRRKYRLLPDGRMVKREAFEATEPKKTSGDNHAARS